MKAARLRISGIGELVKEWKRSLEARTCFDGPSVRVDTGGLTPVCAKLERKRLALVSLPVQTGAAAGPSIPVLLVPMSERARCGGRDAWKTPLRAGPRLRRDDEHCVQTRDSAERAASSAGRAMTELRR